MVRANRVYFVGDKSSSWYGKLAYFDGTWKDHLARDIERDFQDSSLEARTELAPPKRKTSSRDLEVILQQQDCCGFFHFTDVQNLPTIFERGYIASRTVAEEQDLLLFDTLGGIGEMDHLVSSKNGWTVQDYARFTVQPDNPILFHWQGVTDGKFVPQPCIIRVDPRIVVIKGVRFSYTNANTSFQNYGLSHEFLQLIPIRNLQRSRGSSTYARGAEVMYPKAAPINFVEDIGFRSPAEMKHARNLTPDSLWRKHYKKGRDFPFRFRGLENSYVRPTYIWNATLSVEEPDLENVLDDQDQIPLTAENIYIKFNMQNPLIDDGVRVEVWRDNKLVGQWSDGLEMAHNVNLKPSVDGSGKYTAKICLLRDEVRYELYSTTFEVA
jgi:hypothetical protein